MAKSKSGTHSPSVIEAKKDLIKYGQRFVKIVRRTYLPGLDPKELTAEEVSILKNTSKVVFEQVLERLWTSKNEHQSKKQKQ